MFSLLKIHQIIKVTGQTSTSEAGETGKCRESQMRSATSTEATEPLDDENTEVVVLMICWRLSVV